MISIIIPVYNREEELNRAIKSVINQTIKDWELIIVDDYSEKDIKAILNSFSDERIKYYRLYKKGNANVCRNVGIKNAIGEYIAMLDSDDEWKPNHLEKSLETLITFDTDGIFSSYIIDDGEKEIKNIIRPLRINENMVNYIMDGNSAATPTHFYKTICAKKILWDENLIRHQDYDFAIRFADKFNFFPCYNFTVIVHWKKNEKRLEHIPSQIKFLEIYKTQINKKLFLKYNIGTLSLLLTRKDIDSNTINYFRKNILNEIKYISLTDFMSIYGNKLNSLSKFKLRIIYLVKVLFS